MHKIPARFAATAAVAGALTLSISGCTAKPLPEPQYPPPVESVNTGYGSCPTSAATVQDVENRSRCLAQINAEDKRQNDRADAAHAAAVAQYERELAAYKASLKSPWDRVSDRLNAVVFIGLAALLIGAWEALRTRNPLEKLPQHRSPDGPAAGALRADARADSAVGWVGVGVGPAIMLAGFGVVGPAVIAGLIGGLIAWGAGSRVVRLSRVKRGFDVADRQWTAASEAAGTLLPEPVLTAAEALDLAVTGGFEAPEGSAAATMLSADGKDGPVRAAWARVAQALKLGDTDEQGRFTPFATVAAVTVSDNGDVEVVWDLDGVGRTESDMSRASGPLLRELRVKEMPGGFRRNVSTGQVVATFSNGAAAAGPAAAGPSRGAQADDDWDF